MVNYTITSLMDVAVLVQTGTNGLFFDLLLLPVFIILMASFRNTGSGDGIDSMNISSFVCLFISFMLVATGLGSIVVTGIFMALCITGLIAKRFWN